MGSNGLPERQERRHAPRCALPRPPTCACLGSKSCLCARNTLTCVCARDAQAKPRSSTPPPPTSPPTSFPPSPLPPRRFPSPHRCRPNACSLLRPCAPSRGHGSDPRGWVARILGFLTLVVAVGVRRWRVGWWGAQFRALVHACVLSLWCPYPWGVLETAEMVPCAHTGSNCVVFCIVSLTVIIDGP